MAGFLGGYAQVQQLLVLRLEMAFAVGSFTAHAVKAGKFMLVEYDGAHAWPLVLDLRILLPNRIRASTHP